MELNAQLKLKLQSGATTEKVKLRDGTIFVLRGEFYYFFGGRPRRGNKSRRAGDGLGGGGLKLKLKLKLQGNSGDFEVEIEVEVEVEGHGGEDGLSSRR